MIQQWIHIAASRERLHSATDLRHWRLYVGESLQEIAIREIRFIQHNGTVLPLVSASSKTPNEHGLFVWFDFTAGIFLDDTQTKVTFEDSQGSGDFQLGVRTECLYQADEWRHWGIHGMPQGFFATRDVGFYRDRQKLQIFTHSQKQRDDRGIMASLRVLGSLRIDENESATITLATRSKPT